MTSSNKEEIALIPTERSTPSGVKRSYEAQLETRMIMDAITSEIRSLVVQAIEIELDPHWSENRAR